MALYLISYDINEKDDFEYGPLTTLLKEIGAVRILYSEWAIVEKVAQAGAIFRTIAPKVQNKDRLLVQELTKDAAWDKLLISDAEFNKMLAHARG